ncbi:MAG: hypothetical protein ABJA67_11345 [Chthonomonadales bacterium]
MPFNNPVLMQVSRHQGLRISPRSRMRGTSFVEVLVSALVFAVCTVVIILLWKFNYNMSQLATDQGIATNLARQQMEVIKETGFYNTPEYTYATPLVHYYDGAQVLSDANTANARYKVTTTVMSDLTVTGSIPTAPAGNALRTVMVKVTVFPTITGYPTLATMSTYLARAGI